MAFGRFLWSLLKYGYPLIVGTFSLLSSHDSRITKMSWFLNFCWPVHVLIECSFLNVYRQSLGDDIVDLLDVSFSVDLFQKDDICALSIMLGGFWDMYPDIEKDIYSSFITNSVKHIKRMIEAYGQRLIFG